MKPQGLSENIKIFETSKKKKMQCCRVHKRFHPESLLIKLYASILWVESSTRARDLYTVSVPKFSFNS